MIVSEMVIDGLHNKKSTNSGKNKMGEPVEMSEYDKMFDDVLLSYDKPIDEDNFHLLYHQKRKIIFCPERADIQTPQQVYNPKLQYSNLFLPETISLRRKDSTTSSCVNIGSYVSSTAPSVASTFASNLFNRDKSESIYEKRERKHLVKKMKSERRQIKTSNRKAFTKEITRQKKIQSVTANRRTLNY
ncbi:hypothetical protein MXB_5046 [Myxobolus squamalis]|nr:hypothetical protein MXB_5046 [Myxobolus squamalis]